MQDQLHAELRATLENPFFPTHCFIPLYTREFVATFRNITRTNIFFDPPPKFPCFRTRPIDTRGKNGRGRKKRGGKGRKQEKINNEDETVTKTVYPQFRCRRRCSPLFMSPRKILNPGKREEGPREGAPRLPRGNAVRTNLTIKISWLAIVFSSLVVPLFKRSLFDVFITSDGQKI